MKRIDELLTALILLVVTMAIIWLSKKIYDLCHRRLDLHAELTEHDNHAVATSVCGYLLGVVFALSGILAGEDLQILDEVIDLVTYGLLAIALLNLSTYINDRVIFHRFDNHKELVVDRNVGLGAVEGAFSAASGLVLAGALYGEGSVFTALVFWFLGQVVFLLLSKIYNLITPFDFVAEIEKDNTAVGFAFAGILLAFANLVRVASAKDFHSWKENLTFFVMVVCLGLVVFPILRFFTDKILLPRANLTHELVQQDHPNIGVGLLEGTVYLIVSLAIGWVL